MRSETPFVIRRPVLAVLLLGLVGIGAAPDAGARCSADAAASVPPIERPAPAVEAPVSHVTILNFSDWHGNLRPSRPPNVREDIGGASYLQAYFELRAAANPGNTFVVTAGDEVGATPASSSLLGDEPAMGALNLMGVDANTFGNHNFDNGVEHMKALASRATWPYVAVNLRDAAGNTPDWFRRSTTWTTADGVRIGVTGAINTDAATLIKAGGLGDLRVMADMDATAAALNDEAAALRASGIRTVIALAHMGATGPADGPLFDLAKRLVGVDLLVGDHTTLAANRPAVGADGRPLHVIQSLRNGWSFTTVDLTIERATGRTLSIEAVSAPTLNCGVKPDPEMEAFIGEVEKVTASKRATVVGRSTVPLPQNTAIAEANQGNLVTDAVRERYRVDFVIQNSGGLRGDFTRDQGADGLYPITLGDVLTVLPFTNTVTTMTITGSELRTMLEHGVSAVPYQHGRFPQISGFQFGYRVLRPPGLRVEWVRWPDGRPVDLSSEAEYTIAMNDFMAGGGDGYGPFAGVPQTREPLEQVIVEYLGAHSPVTPSGPISPAVIPETRIFRVD